MNFSGYISFYGTANIAKTHQFYSEFLGLKLWKDQGVCRIYLLPGGNLLGFCEHMPVDTDASILTFLTDDVDGVYSLFISANIAVLDEPKLNKKFNIYHFFANDPDGHRLEIQNFLY